MKVISPLLTSCWVTHEYMFWCVCVCVSVLSLVHTSQCYVHVSLRFIASVSSLLGQRMSLLLWSSVAFLLSRWTKSIMRDSISWHQLDSRSWAAFNVERIKHLDNFYAMQVWLHILYGIFLGWHCCPSYAWPLAVYFLWPQTAAASRGWVAVDLNDIGLLRWVILQRIGWSGGTKWQPGAKNRFPNFFWGQMGFLVGCNLKL